MGILLRKHFSSMCWLSLATLHSKHPWGMGIINTDKEIQLLQVSLDSMFGETQSWVSEWLEVTPILEKGISFMSSDAYILEAQGAPWIFTCTRAWHMSLHLQIWPIKISFLPQRIHLRIHTSSNLRFHIERTTKRQTNLSRSMLV